MSLIDDMFGGGEEDAAREEELGNERAKKYFEDFFQGGKDDYGKFRDFIGGIGENLDGYGNPSEWMWDNINQSPSDFYQKLMEGYTKTPQAEMQMKEMQDAVNAGASASGLLGSNANLEQLQDRSNNIISADQDRYLNNMLGVNDQQRNYLNDFRGEQDRYQGGLWDSANMGYNAGSNLAGLEQNIGNARSNQARGRASKWANMAGAAAGAARMGYGGF